MNLWTVPLADIDLGEDEIHAVTDVLRSKWLSMGPVTAEFERQFAEMVGVQARFCRDQLYGSTAPGAPGARCRTRRYGHLPGA